MCPKTLGAKNSHSLGKKFSCLIFLLNFVGKIWQTFLVYFCGGIWLKIWIEGIFFIENEQRLFAEFVCEYFCQTFF